MNKNNSLMKTDRNGANWNVQSHTAILMFNKF